MLLLGEHRLPNLLNMQKRTGGPQNYFLKACIICSARILETAQPYKQTESGCVAR